MANSVTCLEEENGNKRVVMDLYKALVSKDTNTMHRLLAPYLEWWFHGPPSHRHHLVPFLTSSSTSSSPMPLVPDLMVGFGSVVVAEGFDEANLVWWVHAWTTCNGIITEVREYVNTSLTVTRLGLHEPKSRTVTSSEVVASSTCQCIWQSKICDNSVPGPILAI